MGAEAKLIMCTKLSEQYGVRVLLRSRELLPPKFIRPSLDLFSSDLVPFSLFYRLSTGSGEETFQLETFQHAKAVTISSEDSMLHLPSKRHNLPSRASNLSDPLISPVDPQLSPV